MLISESYKRVRKNRSSAKRSFPLEFLTFSTSAKFGANTILKSSSWHSLALFNFSQYFLSPEKGFPHIFANLPFGFWTWNHYITWILPFLEYRLPWLTNFEIIHHHNQRARGCCIFCIWRGAGQSWMLVSYTWDHNRSGAAVTLVQLWKIVFMAPFCFMLSHRSR